VDEDDIVIGPDFLYNINPNARLTLKSSVRNYGQDYFRLYNIRQFQSTLTFHYLIGI
jgi:hypothetical protein